MAKKINSKKANVEVKTAASVETTAINQTEKALQIESYADIMPAFEIPTVEENTVAASVEEKTENTAASEQTENREEMTIEEFATARGIKVDWDDKQKARWLEGATQVDGKYIFVEDATYKNIEKHEKWRPTLQAVKGNKLCRIGRNFGDALIERGEAIIAKGIGEYKADKAAEKAKAKAEKAAAREAKKAASKK